MQAKSNNNIFQIPNNEIGINTIIVKNYVLELKKPEDKINYEILSDALLKKTMNFSKENLVKKGYELFDLKYKALTKEFQNQIILQIKFQYINYDNMEYETQVINFIKELTEKIITAEKEIITAIRNYQTYFKTIDDNPKEKALFEFKDQILKPDFLYMSKIEIQKYINELSPKDILQLEKKIQNNSNVFYTFQTNEKNVLKTQNIIQEIEKKSTSLNQMNLNEINLKKKKYSFVNEVIEKYEKKEKNKQVILQIMLTIDKLEDTFEHEMIVLNSMIGGTSTSILFKEIREKHSFCYSIYSQVIKNYGIKIFTEVEENNLKNTQKEIEKCLKSMKKEISIEEFETTKKRIISEYQKKSRDFNLNEKLIIDNAIKKSQLQTIDEIILKIKNIKIEDMSFLMNKLEITKILMTN